MGIGEDAIDHIKKNKKWLIEKYANPTIYFPSPKPLGIFMAGSPGAGKTEYSKSFIKALESGDEDHTGFDKHTGIVRIDADEIRECIPGYNGKNSDIVQGAASLGVQKLFDYVVDKRVNFILDGTFAKYEIAHKNVERCLKHNIQVGITYVYQDPIIAWGFTKKREKLEGRSVPKGAFVEAYFNSKDNVNKIKKEFDNQVIVVLVIKNFENKEEKFHLNIDNIDSFLKNKYKPDILSKLLK